MRKFYWILLNQMGLNFRKFFLSFFRFPRFFSDYIKFSKLYNGKIVIKPCIHDSFDEAGVINDEYFVQDLIVAKIIFIKNPQRHVDIGSRIDGFIAHLASYREVDVIDIRPIKKMVAGINFIQMDFMVEDDLFIDQLKTDSLSCLHTIEHFGLGRYGDEINPDGYKIGIMNLSKLLEIGGTLYLSTPVGMERVEFNANRVFDPATIINEAKKNSLDLTKFTLIDSHGESVELELENVLKLKNDKYNLGIFEFIKVE